MKNIFISLLLLVIFSNCSEDDFSPSRIIGEWQLTEAKFNGFQSGLSFEGTIDYSKENIIYNFQRNGKLIVTGGENAGYNEGEYEYFFGEDYLGAPGDPKILLVKINDSNWSYDLIDKNKMRLSKSYVDGPDLFFTKK